MMLLMVIVLCAGLVGAAPGQVKDDRLNFIVDQLLDDLQVVLIESGFDPVALPNTSMGFSDVVLGVEWHGVASLYDGWMRGLGSIHRSGNTEFIRTSEGRIVGIISQLSLGNMKGHYECLAKFMDLGPVADVYLEIAGADVYFEIILDPQACRFRVEAMQVKNIGSIDVSIKGLSVLGWLIATLADFVGMFIKGFLSNFIESTLRDIANDYLQDVKLGFAGFILGCERPPLFPL